MENGRFYPSTPTFNTGINKGILLKNSFFNATGAAIRMLLGILTVPLLINIIGIDQYGLWTLVSTALAIVALAEGGLSVSTIVFVSQDIAKDDWTALSETLTIILTAMLLMATLAAAAMWFGADTIISFFPKLNSSQIPDAARAIQLGGIVIWTRLLQQVAAGVVQAYTQYGILNVLRTIQSALQTIGLVLVAYLGGSVTEMMQWLVVVGILMLIGYAAFNSYLLKGLPIKPAWNKKKGTSILNYSLLSWGASLGGMLFSRFDRLLVGRILGTSALGIYAAITEIAVQINSFSAIAVQPILPVLSADWTNKEVERSEIVRKVKQAFQINVLLALSMGAGLLAFAPWILNIVFSESNADNILFLFKTAVIIYALYSINAVGYYILYGIKMVSAIFKVQLIVGIISLAAISMSAYKWGLTGAIIGNIAYMGISYLTFYSMKMMNISVSHWLRWIWFPLFCFIGFLFITWYPPPQMMQSIFLFSGLLFLFTGWFVFEQKVISKSFLNYILKK